MRGRMGTRVAVEEFSADTIKKMQDQIKLDEVELRQVVDRKYDLDPIVYELKTKMDEYVENKNKWKGELDVFTEQISELKKFEAVCVKKVKEMTPDEEKQRDLESSLEKYREEFNKADGNAAKLRDENEKLNQKIVDINKKILDGPKAELAQLEKEINEANSQLTNLTVEIKTSKRQLTNCQKKLASLKEDLEANETSLQKFETRLETLDQDIKEMSEQHEEAKREAGELSKEIAEMSKSIKHLETQKQKLETERIDLSHSYEKVANDLNQHKHEHKHYEHLLSGLKLHIIDDLETIGGDEEMAAESTLKKYDQDDMLGVTIESVKRDVHKQEEHLKNLTPNLAAIQSFRDLVYLHYYFFCYLMMSQSVMLLLV